MLALLCARQARAWNSQVARAARMPCTRLAAMLIPMPVPHINNAQRIFALKEEPRLQAGRCPDNRNRRRKRGQRSWNLVPLADG